MWQWDVRDATSRASAANGGFERHLAPETIDGETAEKKDDARSEKRELLIEPRTAERDLRRRGATIAAAGRRFSRKALRDGGAIWKMVLVDAGLPKPAPQLRARAAAERLTRR